jgi:hypothetical protein
LNKSQPIRLYTGFDDREAVGYHVFCASVIERATVPVQFCPLTTKVSQGIGQRDGTNAFTYSRFLIPYLENFEGWAIFADGADMLCLADIAELAKLYDPSKAVQVVKHEYRTSNARKYIGTAMEADNADYSRKNWSSLMLINCAHYAWRQMRPDAVAELPGSYLHRFGFIEDRYIGSLPGEWNHLVGEYAVDPDAKMLHFTLGIPAMKHYKHCEGAPEWFSQRDKVLAAC